MTSKVTGKRYTEDERDTFCDLAAEHGVSYTIRALGYPDATATAYRWLEVRGIEPPQSALAIASTSVRDWYGDAERRLVTQQVLDRAFDILSAGHEVMVPTFDADTGKQDGVTFMLKQVDADGLKSIAATVRNAITTLQLLDGKATQVLEHHVEQPELLALVEEYRAKNAEQIRHLKAV